jgi:enediyne biosynthesis protein E4
VRGFRWAILLFALGSGCPHQQKLAVENSPPAVVSSPPPGLFRNVTKEAGITFQEDNGARGKFTMIETTPGGCAFLDADNDGWLDIFLVQSGDVPGVNASVNSGKRPTCKFYRNQGDGSFIDKTTEAGLDFDQGYAQAVSVGDYDNDGNADIFLSGYARCFLLKGDGKGHFTDTAEKAGVSEKDKKRWATSSAFADFNSDGKLDLIVLHYVPWTPETDKACKDTKGRKAYCSPEVYHLEHPTLYQNKGDGTFADVSEQAGLTHIKGRGLAVLWTDFNADNKPDVVIANDLQPNHVLQNMGNGKFKEVGLPLGLAYGPDGQTLSGMGIGAGDLENQGKESFAFTNFSGQPHTLYRPLADSLFEDITYKSGIGEISHPFLAFGISFIDYDRDSWQDIIIGNGHIDPNITDSAVGVDYKEPKLLFQNSGNGQKFTRIKDIGDANVPRVTRGLVVGDYDNDGRVDVLTNNHNDAAELLHNESKDTNHWITFRLEGVKCNRDAAGARFFVTAGGKRYFAYCRLAGSFASSSDKRLYFGLGKVGKVDSVEVIWPDGSKNTYAAPLKADDFYYIKQGAAPVPDLRITQVKR